ncbi:MAG: SH3 domain-containing protein [Clostridia bacterium]|nr:SH3 domain-containing protein [Clostridia bacterium]
MDLLSRILTFSCSVITALAVGISAEAQTGTVTATSLNVRSSTTTSSDVITKVHNGDKLEILASDGAWYKIQLSDGTCGFVSSDYLEPDEATFGVVTATSLIVRSSTGTSSDAITQLPYGRVVELLAYDGAWYKISYENGQIGYVSADYISLDLSLAVETPYVVYGYINATSLNIRSTTSVNSDSIAKLPMGTCIEILAYDGIWYHIKATDGITGYAKAEYVSMTPVESDLSLYGDEEYENDSITYNSAPLVTVPHAPEPPGEEARLLGEAIIAEAKNYMGRPYVWAASGPDSFDCSGFTMYIMNLFGISLPHQSGQQYNYGKSVEKTNLVAGDLVFFKSPNTSGVAHVGIYIGDGNFIHASSGRAKSVTISSLGANYYTKHYLGARRVTE